jgi:hypothetical protein
MPHPGTLEQGATHISTDKSSSQQQPIPLFTHDNVLYHSYLRSNDLPKTIITDSFRRRGFKLTHYPRFGALGRCAPMKRARCNPRRRWTRARAGRWRGGRAVSSPVASALQRALCALTVSGVNFYLPPGQAPPAHSLTTPNTSAYLTPNTRVPGLATMQTPPEHRWGLVLRKCWHGDHPRMALHLAAYGMAISEEHQIRAAQVKPVKVRRRVLHRRARVPCRQGCQGQIVHGGLHSRHGPLQADLFQRRQRGRRKRGPDSSTRLIPRAKRRGGPWLSLPTHSVCVRSARGLHLHSQTSSPAHRSTSGGEYADPAAPACPCEAKARSSFKANKRASASESCFASPTASSCVLAFHHALDGRTGGALVI